MVSGSDKISGAGINSRSLICLHGLVFHWMPPEHTQTPFMSWLSKFNRLRKCTPLIPSCDAFRAVGLLLPTGRYSRAEKQTMSGLFALLFFSQLSDNSCGAAPEVFPDIYLFALVFYLFIFFLDRLTPNKSQKIHKHKMEGGWSSPIDPPMCSSSSRDGSALKRIQEPAYSHNSGNIERECLFSRSREQKPARDWARRATDTFSPEF